MGSYGEALVIGIRIGRRQLVRQGPYGIAKLLARVVFKAARRVDAFQDRAAAVVEPRHELLLERRHRTGVQPVDGVGSDGQQQRRLMAQRQRIELRLVQDRADALSVLDGLAGVVVDHGAEAGEQLELQELRVFQAQALRPAP